MIFCKKGYPSILLDPTVFWSYFRGPALSGREEFLRKSGSENSCFFRRVKNTSGNAFCDFGVSLEVHFGVQGVTFFPELISVIRVFFGSRPGGVRDPILLQEHCVLRG